MLIHLSLAPGIGGPYGLSSSLSYGWLLDSRLLCLLNSRLPCDALFVVNTVAVTEMG